MTRPCTLRTAVSSLALASLLLTAPFTPRLGEVLGQHGLGAAAMAKEGGDDSGGDDHGGDHGGSHDSGDDDSGDDSGSDDHGSGGHGSDDGAAHDAGDDHGGRRHRDGQATDGVTDTTAGTETAGRDVARIERSARGIEVTYADGWSEELESGRYELKDARNRTVVERPATSADLARLQALLP